MISLYDGKLTDLLRNDFSADPQVQALAYAVLQEKRRLIDLAKGTRTLAVIDELPESVLDLLSVELRTPFYDERFPIATKRDLIKRTFIFYQFMGTPDAVAQMVGSAFPGSKIEEWFFYGGEPYHFQVVIETSRARQTADVQDITRAVEKCKRLSAHSDGVIFQCGIGIRIRTKAHGYKYNSRFTGRYESGTVPWRSTHGKTGAGAVTIETGQTAFRYHTDLAGTKPWRSTHGGAGDGTVEVRPETAAYKYTAAAAGTEPWRNTRPANTDGGVEIGTTAQGYKTTATPTGRRQAGTEPWRNTRPGAQDAAIGIQATGEGYSFTASFAGQAQAGTTPHRTTHGGAADGGVAIEAEAEGYSYNTPVSGRQEAGIAVERDTSGAGERGAIYAEAEAQAFRYSVKMCGRSYCRNGKGAKL